MLPLPSCGNEVPLTLPTCRRLPPPLRPHAEPTHRVTASHAAHLPPTPYGAPRIMVSSREEVHGEGARRVSEREKTVEFWAGQALFAVASATAGPSSLAPLPVSASLTQTSPRAKPLEVVPTAPSAVAGRAAFRGRLVRRGKWPAQTRQDIVLAGRSPDPPPTTTSSAPYRGGGGNPRPGIVRARPSRSCPSWPMMRVGGPRSWLWRQRRLG